jgi:quercetin dioxygenase-like cupin family protein
MSDLIEQFVPTREQINKLQAEMVNMPQAELTTEHYFSGGMYCRKVFRPAGTLIVGKIHKEDHLFMCAMGQIMAWTEKGMKTLNAGDVVESKSGTKRVTLALTDAIGITIHKTDEKDLEIIEKQLIESDNLALFDFNNELKKFIITDKENTL